MIGSLLSCSGKSVIFRCFLISRSFFKLKVNEGLPRMAPFFIRNLVHDDIPELVLLPQSEGREMGQAPEIETWLKIDPHGIFIAVDAENGEIAGCCSGIILSEYHGYVGLYVVSKKHRGTGLGKILWQAAVSHLGSRNMCLSSVDKMVRCYKDKAGFSVEVDWTIDLYSSTSPTLPSDACLQGFPGADLNTYTVVVESAGPFVEYVIDYDSSLHGYNRSNIVQSTVAERGTVTIAAISMLDNGLSVVGYACMKKSLQGHWLIAPLYADNYSSAYFLLHGLLGCLTPEQLQEGVVVKVISSNTDAAKLYYQFGIKKTKYQLRRLYTQQIVNIPQNRIFALQSSVFCTE